MSLRQFTSYATLIGLTLAFSPSLSAQEFLGVGAESSGNDGVAISLTETTIQRLERHLTEEEVAATQRLFQYNQTAQWSIQRLTARRETVESDLSSYRTERELVSPVLDPEMRQLLSALMREAQLILQIIRQLEDAQDGRLNGLLEVASTARHLRIKLETELSDINSAEARRADDELTSLGTEGERLIALNGDLLEARETAEQTLSDRRNRLDEARVRLRRAEAQSAIRETEGEDAIQGAELIRDQVARTAIFVCEAIAIADNERLVRKLTALSFLTVRRLGLLRSNAFGLASLGQALETRDLNVIAARILGRDLIRDNSGLALSAAQAGVWRGLQTATPEVNDFARDEAYRGYSLTRLRLVVQRLERQCELDRESLETVDLGLEQVRLRLAVSQFLSDSWQDRRDEAAAREIGGTLSREVGAFDRENLRALLVHTTSLFNSAPSLARDEARINLDNREPLSSGTLLFLAAAALMTALIGSRLNRPLLTIEAASRLDAGLLKALRWVLRVLPLTVLILLAMSLGLVPHALEPLAWWVAIIIPLVTGLRPLMLTLLPIDGTEAVNAASSRYLRAVIRMTVQVGLLLHLFVVVMPLLGYAGGAIQPIRGAFLVTCVLGLVGVLMRQRALLNLLGPEDSTARLVILLRNSVKRLYPLLILGPAASVVVYLIGYRNLARLIIGRGLLVLAVLTLFPWLNGQLLGIARRVTAFPEGGGPLLLPAQTSKVSYRLASPIISLFSILVGFAAVAAGWGYQGDLLSSLANPLVYPLLRVGETAITPLSILIFIAVVIATVVVIKWALSNLRRRVYPLYDLTPGMRASIDTLVKYLLFVLGFVIGLKSIGLSLGFLAVFAGIIGIGIGFGSQALMANFIAGLILQFTRPVEVGDEIEVEGVLGTVVRITSYSTVVRTYDNLSVVVPNAVLIGNQVINWSEDDHKVRVDIAVGVAYGSDVERVSELLLNAADSHTRLRKYPEPKVHFENFGDSSLDFSLRFWIDDPKRLRDIKSDLRFEIERLFRAADIEIPFPQRDLHLRTAEGTLAHITEKGWDVASEEPPDAVDPAGAAADNPGSIGQESQ